MRKLIAVISIVIVYIWDDVLLAAPIVASAAIIGPLTTFGLFFLLYGTGSYIVAIKLVRIYERDKSQKSRLALWLDEQQNRPHGWVLKKTLSLGGVIGFVLSSWLAGGILTTFAIRYSGRGDSLHKLAAASSTIFAIGFVGQYAGIAGLIL
ncbi:MAG: hypothetical protein WD061_01890 [Candidatus Saccharimonadales bacterium]